MAKQRFLNNFTSTFIAAVKDAPSSGTPETELDYGVLRISDGAAGSLINPTDGDYYLLTAFKRSGSVESNIEVMRVTGVNNAIPGECRITVQRAQEGTSAKAFVAGDYLSLRITKGTAENFSQPADLATKEPVIAAPVSAPTEKYWRGDKTWRDFFTDVRAATLTGLSTATNAVVAATDTVLAAIGKLQAQLDLKAPLASPSFTGTPTGITKEHVGLGNVDNTSDANKPVSTAQAAAIAERYGKNNVLGPVSQSAGVPTGAVIERGSNANGEYLRFADGTQICAVFSSFTEAAEVVWTYPAVFAASPNYLSASASHPPGPRYYNVDTAMTGGNTSATIYRSVRETLAPVIDGFGVCVMAVGRWF